MDKNKSTHKVKGLPPIYYLNLDGQPERKQYMEDQFKYWEIEDYTRISAYDGRDDDLSDILKGKYPEMMTSGEVGCVTSHLKAIKHWLDTSDSPCAIMMEDDCDLDTIKHWQFTWKEFFAKVPYDYDVVQLAIINPIQISIKMHKRFVNDFSTACYVISRHYAQKLINLHVRDDKYKLDNGVKPRAVADDLIYNSGNTFSIPLLMYKIELGSSIHGDHIAAFHRSSYEGLWGFWRNDSNKIDNWDQIFEYDPYFGTLPPGTEQRVAEAEEEARRKQEEGA
jgi:GR25 family glycosyltransferase involved in LPS biosynthesis